MFLLYSPISLLAQSEISSNVVISRFGDLTTKAYINIFSEKKVKIRTDRVYHHFTKNQIHLTQGGFTGYLLDGKYEVLNEKNKLVIQGCIKDGLKHGIWKYWNSDGQLGKTETWKNGKLNGTFQEFDNGQLSRTGKYKNGVLHGNMISFTNGEKIQYYKI